jgi:hypothetical protein
MSGIKVASLAAATKPGLLLHEKETVNLTNNNDGDNDTDDDNDEQL